MKRLQTETLIAAMNSICYVATGEPSGISEVWNGDLDELEEHLEKIEIYAEDEGMSGVPRTQIRSRSSIGRESSQRSYSLSVA